MVDEIKTPAHPDYYIKLKKAIAREMYNFHIEDTLKVEIPTEASGEWSENIAEAFMAKNRKDAELRYAMARDIRASISSIDGQRFDEIYGQLSLSRREKIVATAVSILTKAQATASENEKALINAYLSSLNTSNRGISTLNLENISFKEIDLIEDSLNSLISFNEKLRNQILKLTAESRLRPGEHLDALKEARTELDKAIQNLRSEYRETGKITQPIIDKIGSAIEKIRNTNKNYREIYTRGKRTLPLFVMSVIKLVLVLAVLGCVIGGFFFTPLFFVAAGLGIAAGILAAIQYKLTPTATEQPTSRGPEPSNQAIPGGSAEGFNNPIIKAVKSALFEHILPAFGDAFKYGRLLYNQSSDPANTIDGYAAGAKVLEGLIAEQSGLRPQSQKSLQAQSHADLSAKQSGLRPQSQKADQAQSHAIDNNRIDDPLELRSVSERPSTQGSQLRPDSQQSWRSSFGDEPEWNSSPSAKSAGTGSINSQTLRNLKTKKTATTPAPDESDPSRPTSKRRPAPPGTSTR